MAYSVTGSQQDTTDKKFLQVLYIRRLLNNFKHDMILSHIDRKIYILLLFFKTLPTVASNMIFSPHNVNMFSEFVHVATLGTRTQYIKLGTRTQSHL